MQEKKLHTIVLDDHQCLLDSLRQKNSEEAQAIMRTHLNHARDIYFDLIGEEENWLAWSGEFFMSILIIIYQILLLYSS